MASLARNAAATVVCLFVICSLTTYDARGFAPRGKKDDKPKRHRFTGSGTIEALLPNLVIKFTLDNNETCHVKLEAPKRQRDKQTRRYVLKGGTEVQVTGTAKLDFLRSGMFVRFSAEFDAKGKTSDKIDLLTIFTPDESRKVGVFREGFVEGDKEAPKTARYLVAGQLASLKKGKMTVVVGGKKVQVAVADNLKIKVDVGDPSLVKKGDKIEVRGYYFKKGAVFGEIVTIELSEPLSGEQKKTKKPRRSSKKKPKNQEK